MGRDGDPQQVLRRIGLVAIGVGSLDLLTMIYAVTHGMDYSSGLNFFAIIAGIFLYRGSVRAATLCANSCACLLGMTVAGVGLMVPLLLTLFPLDFLVAVFTHDPNLRSASFVFTFLWGGVAVALFAYMNRALTTGAVTGVYGVRPPQPYWRSRWSAAGLMLMAVSMAAMGIFLTTLFNSDPAHRAVQKARERLGAASASYGFQLTNLHIVRDDSGTTVDARVIAYNSREVKPLEVKWEE